MQFISHTSCTKLYLNHTASLWNQSSDSNNHHFILFKKSYWFQYYLPANKKLPCLLLSIKVRKIKLKCKTVELVFISSFLKNQLETRPALQIPSEARAEKIEGKKKNYRNGFYPLSTAGWQFDDEDSNSGFSWMPGVCWDLSKIRCLCPNGEEEAADGEGFLARRSCRAPWQKHILGRDKNVHTENSRHGEYVWDCTEAQREAGTARITLCLLGEHPAMENALEIQHRRSATASSQK